MGISQMDRYILFVALKFTNTDWPWLDLRQKYSLNYTPVEKHDQEYQHQYICF